MKYAPPITNTRITIPPTTPPTIAPMLLLFSTTTVTVGLRPPVPAGLMLWSKEAVSEVDKVVPEVLGDVKEVVDGDAGDVENVDIDIWGVVAIDGVGAALEMVNGPKMLIE